MRLARGGRHAPKRSKATRAAEGKLATQPPCDAESGGGAPPHRNAQEAAKDTQSLDRSSAYEADRQGLKHTLQEELIEGALAAFGDTQVPFKAPFDRQKIALTFSERESTVSADALTDGERRLQSLIHGSNEPVSTLERQWALTRLGIPETTIPHEREATRAAVSTVSTIPALASLAENMKAASLRDETNLDEIIEVIRKDPAISARILRMANSVHVASANPVKDLECAVQLLGLRWVRLVSLSLTTIANTKNLIETINWSCLWMHSYACGRISNAIAANLGLAASDSLHSAGLFHDIGKIILSYLYPQEYRQALLTAFNQKTSLSSIEKLIFDMTHEEAGACFARQSNFPPDLSAALHFHSNPGLAEGAALEVCALVNLANHISKLYGLGYSGDPLDAGVSTDDLPGWQLLLENHHTMPASPEILEEALVPIVRDVKQELKTINR